MSNILLRNILRENIQIANPDALEKAALTFAQQLISSGDVITVHRPETSADGQIDDYAEDLAEQIRNEVMKWANIVNSRGGR